MSKNISMKALAAIVGRKGGCTLATLLNEAKKEWPQITRADVVNETEEGVSLAEGLDDLVDFKAYTLPVSPDEAAAIAEGKSQVKLRYFFVPKDTVFLGEDDEDSEEDARDEPSQIDLSSVERFFVVASSDTKSTVEEAPNVGAAIGKLFAAMAVGADSTVYAGVPISIRYEATVGNMPLLEDDSQGDDADPQEGGDGEGGDADEEEGDE